MAKKSLSKKKLMSDPAYFIEKIVGMKLTSYQKEWLRRIEKYKRVTFMAFRSSGKTRQMIVHHSIWKAMVNPASEYLVISKTLEQARKILKDIRITILTNKMLKSFVPSNRSQVWSSSALELENHSIIKARAYNENIRGEHVDGVYCDELGEYEDHEVLKKAVLPTIRAKRGFFVGLGTPKSELDLLHEIERDPGFKSIHFDRFPAEGEKGNLFEERYPDVKIVHNPHNVEIIDKKTKAVIETYSNMTWAQEFLLTPVSLKDKLYPDHLIKACLDEGLCFSEQPVNMRQYFMGCDFAMSAQSGSDYTVITILEKAPGNPKLKLVYMERFRGLDYNLQKARIKELAQRFNIIKALGDEGSFGKVFILDLKADGVPIEGYKIHHQSGSKEELIKSLRDQFEKQGFVFPYSHNDVKTKTLMDVMIDELTKFGIIFDMKSKTVKFEGSGKHDDCHPAGTLVQTEKGLIPIEDIKEGDFVLTHKGRFRKVWRTVKKPYKGSIYEISPYGGLPIRVTPEHPIFSCVKSNSIWKYKDKSKVRRFWSPKWCLPINFKNQKERVMFPIMREEKKCFFSRGQLFLFGLFAADGTYKKNGQMSISFNSLDKKKINRAKKILLSEFGLKGQEYPVKDRNCIILQFNSKKQLPLFTFGKREHRAFPQSFKYFPPEFQMEIYKGYCSGDGYIDSRGNHITATISRELANQIQLFLLRNNKCATIRKLARSRYGVKNKDQYWVSWKLNQSTNTKSKIEGDYLISSVRKFKEGEIEDFVYNLEVEEDESYVSETVIVHNCVISLGLANFIARHVSMGLFSAIKGSQKGHNPFIVASR